MASPTAPGKNNVSTEERLTIDPITGLRNEYLFRLRLRDEFHRARQSETNAALLAVKLDRIMDINARLGRNAGDEALRALSTALKRRLESPDHSSNLLFKLSGPVFGYYLPAWPADRAAVEARETVKLAAESEIFIEPLTVSVGVVNLYEFFTRDETPEKLALVIERTALLRASIAERKGGNSVCSASDLAGEDSDGVCRVLIVDPDPPAIELLARNLRNAGMVVETCRNGETAFTLIQANPPSAVVSETMIPRMNGFMLRDRLRTNVLYRDIPFILVSCKKNEDFIRKAVELDIRHYFKKPISVTEVAGLLRNLLRRAPA